jgi:hypothetical protein
MNSNEFRNEYNYLLLKLRQLNAAISNRALELCKTYPNAPIGEITFARDLSEKTIIDMTVDTQLIMIERIEKYLETFEE